MKPQKPAEFVPPPKPEPVILKITEFTRNGVLKIGFNQPLEVPGFINEEGQAKRSNETRRLVDLTEIDANRDIIELMFILNSDETPENIEYFLELTNWTEEAMELLVNFTNPLIISKGIRPDQVFCKIKHTNMFLAKNSNEKLMSDRVYIQKMIPTQLPKGVSEDEIIGQAKTAQGGILASVIVQLLLQIVLKGSLDRLWNLFFTM